MQSNPAVRGILEVLHQRIPQVLGDNLEGLYVKGSLVLGDFNPETSDVDLLVVIKEPVSEEDFPALVEMHDEIQTLPNPYAHELELAYIPIHAIQSFETRRRYPALERGEKQKLKGKSLGANWILEFWTVREHGVILYGPDPKTLIPPIFPDQIMGAVRTVLAEDWLAWVDTWDDPEWPTHQGEMRFVVETMCRASYTLEYARVSSKPVAVRWALEALAEPWPALIRHSQSWATGGVATPQTVSEVEAFVRWTVNSLEDRRIPPTLSRARRF